MNDAVMTQSYLPSGETRRRWFELVAAKETWIARPAGQIDCDRERLRILRRALLNVSGSKEAMRAALKAAEDEIFWVQNDTK